MWCNCEHMCTIICVCMCMHSHLLSIAWFMLPLCPGVPWFKLLKETHCPGTTETKSVYIFHGTLVMYVIYSSVYFAWHTVSGVALSRIVAVYVCVGVCIIAALWNLVWTGLTLKFQG